METDQVAQFRSLGGRAVLITFQSKEVRDTVIKGQWMKLWFDKVKPWRGEPASLERFVWLSCKGVPLNAWNAKTFAQIAGIWGSFIMLHEETLKDQSFAEGKVLIATEEIRKIDRGIQLEIEGVTYDVLISEVSSFVNPDEVEAGYSQAMKNGFGPKIPVKPVWKVVSSKEKEDDDDVDDVEMIKEKATNSKLVVGERCDFSAGKAGKEAVGSKHEIAGKHLMPEKECSLASCGDFESRVEDSVESRLEGEVDLGLMAQNTLITKEICLAQEGSIVNSSNEGVIGLGHGEKELGLLNIGPNSFNTSSQLGEGQEGQKDLETNLRAIQSGAQVLRDGCAEAVAYLGRQNFGDQTELVRLSQIPSINLMVDLNKAGCRRRRRRHLTNLVHLCEVVDQNPELMAHLSSSSSSSGETLQSNSIMHREISASMAVGAKLGILFRPNDDVILRTMIETETQEYSHMLEREAGG